MNYSWHTDKNSKISLHIKYQLLKLWIKLKFELAFLTLNLS